MATITSIAGTGSDMDPLANATWIGGAVPGPGDTAIFDTSGSGNFRLTGLWDVGADGAAGSIAIQVGIAPNTGTSQFINDGGSLNFRGDIRAFGSSTYGAPVLKRVQVINGALMNADCTNGDRYLIMGSDTDNDNPGLYDVGAAGNHNQWTQSGANKFGIKFGNNSFGSWKFDYSDHTDLKQNPVFATSYVRGPSELAGMDATMGRNATWLRCGAIQANLAGPLDADAPWNWSGKIIDPIGDGSNGVGLLHSNFSSTIATVTYLRVSGPSAIYSLQTDNLAQFHHCTFRNCGFGSGASTVSPDAHHILFIIDAYGVPGAIEVAITASDDLRDSYIIFTRAALHNYFFTFGWSRAQTISRVICERRDTGGAGGGCLGPYATPDAPRLLTLDRIIRLRNVRNDGGNPGAFSYEAGANSNAFIKLTRCTTYVGGNTGGGIDLEGTDIIIGDGRAAPSNGNGFQDQCVERSACVAYSRAPSADGYAVRNVPGATGPTNWLSDANSKTNANWGLAAGSLGDGYDFPVSGPGYGNPGHSDIHADPMPVDDSRNSVSFAHTLDPSIQKITAATTDAEEDASMAATLAILMSMYDDGSPYAGRDLVEEMITHVEGGYAPTNPAYHNTAWDGGDIGAVPFSGAVTRHRHRAIGRGIGRALNRIGG